MRHILLIIGIFIVVLYLNIAQDPEDPAPEFLYRENNRLILVNGYTGETAELPFEVSENDRIEWSPDGQYLLIRMQDIANSYRYCINLYAVEAEEWVSDEPISCAVAETLFSENGSQLLYSTSDGENGTLWLYNLVDSSTQNLYHATEGTDIMPIGVSELEWSPTERYLMFIHYVQIMGGTVNTYIVMDAESHDYIRLNARNSYYASYRPIWSANEDWFLITLKEEYVTSGTMPYTNDKGDVYLVNTETGEKVRLTYTPSLYKQYVHWTEDGQIAFTEIIEQDVNLTIEQALNIAEVPADEIIMPEQIDIEEEIVARRSSINLSIMISPDSEYGAWVTPEFEEDNTNTVELNFGSVFQNQKIVNFSIFVADDSNNVLIGWRPSDYSYSIG